MSDKLDELRRAVNVDSPGPWVVDGMRYGVSRKTLSILLGIIWLYQKTLEHAIQDTKMELMADIKLRGTKARANYNIRMM